MGKTGLVLEGGGMRGAYTAGVLTWLIDHEIEFDYGVGISAGAMNLCSFAMRNKQYLYDVGRHLHAGQAECRTESFIEGTALCRI